MYDTGDRDRTIVSLAIARSWRDEAYREALLARPEEVLGADGLDLGDDVEIRVLEDTETVKHLNLARETTDAAQALDVLRRSIPLPDDCELRVVQSSETVRYIVLPTMTGNVVPTAVPERELARVANTRADSVYNYVDVVSVQTEGAATTTTVVAEAEVVIVLT